MRPDFADLPDYLRAEIAAEWFLLEPEAATYFDTRTTAGRWEIVAAFLATSSGAALRRYLVESDASTLRHLGQLLLERSRTLEKAA